MYKGSSPCVRVREVSTDMMKTSLRGRGFPNRGLVSEAGRDTGANISTS